MADTKACYTLIEGRHCKFWTVEVINVHYLATYGRIGTKGQTQVKTFGSHVQAVAMADKMIREKLNKGYQQVSNSDHPGASDALLRQLVGEVRVPPVGESGPPVETEAAPYRKIRREV